MVGYGCMTCIGNSGPLPESVVEAITQVCSFSCAACLCKLFSAVCCSELYYTVCWLFSVLYCVLTLVSSVQNKLSLYSLFCGKCLGIVYDLWLVIVVAVQWGSADLQCVWILQAPDLSLSQTPSYRETLWQWVCCLAIGILRAVSIPTPVLTTWLPHHWW